MGISYTVSNSESPKELLRKADAALYRAKERQTSCEIFDPETDVRLGLLAPERLKLEEDLRRAIKREEFTLYYQPKVRLGEGDRVEELEALVRWEHPQRGLLLPGEFIPLAEETGLIVPLGRWVMKEACRRAKAWQERFAVEAPLCVCVNVSAEQVRHPGLLWDVRSALRESGLEGSSLVLEITESTLVKGTRETEVVLGELKKLGARLTIDDFGKEYSSLSYLKRLRADALKIDKSFVEDLGEDPTSATIVEAVISLAHSLGLVVVGEGVESAEQLEHLRRMGCDLAQGYHLARPLPSEEVEQRLADRLGS